MSSSTRFSKVGLQSTGRSHFSANPTQRFTRRFTIARSTPREQLGSDDFGSSWSRLALIKRELAVAIAEEDYSTAARLRDEASATEDSLPAQKRILLGLLDKLQNTVDDQDVRERITATQALGDLGDPAALPFLQQVLLDKEIGDIAESSMWTIFMRPPQQTPASANIENLLTEGMVAMSRKNTFSQALEIFSRVIDAAPSFAEGYNKKATLLYLMNEYKEAIEYCDLALELNPFNFGAASGKGICCAAIGEYQEAISAFEMAVAINPRLEHLKHHIAQLRELIDEKEQQQ
jgi:tetratricopeptide (TPR) repeat protein